MTLKFTPMTVMVVDDITDNIDLVKGVLPDSYLVQAAVSGAMALTIIKGRKPDLILLDVMMPDMDGYEVCRILKRDDETKDIPIIFLTANDQIEDIRWWSVSLERTIVNDNPATINSSFVKPLAPHGNFFSIRFKNGYMELGII